MSNKTLTVNNFFDSLFGRAVIVEKIELDINTNSSSNMGGGIFIPSAPADNFALGKIVHIGEGFVEPNYKEKDKINKINGEKLLVGQIIGFRRKGDVIKIPFNLEKEHFIVKEDDIFCICNNSHIYPAQ